LRDITGSTTLHDDLTQDISRLPFKAAKDKMMELFYRHYIKHLLQESAGNISKAAEAAGIQRQYLHRLMKEAGIDADQFKVKSD
jgi:DNA-binding NtrC family response regulator